MSELFLAGLNRDIAQESRREARQTSRRSRRFSRGQNIGRLFGGGGAGALGFLLGGPAGAAIGAGLGSALGQTAATKKARKRVSAGKFFVQQGKDRERQFQQQAENAILTSAISDALTGFSVGGLTSRAAIASRGGKLGDLLKSRAGFADVPDVQRLLPPDVLSRDVTRLPFPRTGVPFRNILG